MVTMASSKIPNKDSVKYGFLQKRSQNKGRFTAENYKRRFFVLNKNNFKYYDGSVEVGVHEAEIKRAFHLRRELGGREGHFRIVLNGKFGQFLEESQVHLLII